MSKLFHCAKYSSNIEKPFMCGEGHKKGSKKLNVLIAKYNNKNYKFLQRF